MSPWGRPWVAGSGEGRSSVRLPRYVPSGLSFSSSSDRSIAANDRSNCSISEAVTLAMRIGGGRVGWATFDMGLLPSTASSLVCVKCRFRPKMHPDGRLQERIRHRGLDCILRDVPPAQEPYYERFSFMSASKRATAEMSSGFSTTGISWNSEPSESLS